MEVLNQTLDRNPVQPSASQMDQLQLPPWTEFRTNLSYLFSGALKRLSGCSAVMNDVSQKLNESYSGGLSDSGELSNSEKQSAPFFTQIRSTFQGTVVDTWLKTREICNRSIGVFLTGKESGPLIALREVASLTQELNTLFKPYNLTVQIGKNPISDELTQPYWSTSPAQRHSQLVAGTTTRFL